MVKNKIKDNTYCSDLYCFHLKFLKKKILHMDFTDLFMIER